MVDFKAQLNKIQDQLNQLIEEINNWPQYRKIGAGIIALGLILLILGIIFY